MGLGSTLSISAPSLVALWRQSTTEQRVRSCRPTNLSRPVTALALAAATFVALAVPALAAIGATLSSSEGRPGDLIVLTTDNHGNPYVYGGLEFNGAQPVYLVGTADFEKE